MLCLTVYVYNFILLLQNVQRRETDVHAGGWKLNPVPMRVRKLVKKGAITQMFSSDSKTDPNSRRRKNQWMTQVKMFIHFRLAQHVLGIIMPIVRRQTVENRVWCSPGCAGCGFVESGHELSALCECKYSNTCIHRTLAFTQCAHLMS